MLTSPPTLADIRDAAARIAAYIHRTPVLTCTALDEACGCRIFLKCENFQKVGAFKIRGACNAVFSLPEDMARRGVVAHSSGNHAQALALAARIRGIAAHVVMPDTAPTVKQAAVAAYGATITLCEPTLEAREATQAQVMARTGAVEIHPYNNYDVIAGAGTAALELLSDVPQLDMVLAPVGGGGLISGTAIAATEARPGVRVLAAEPEQADDAAKSLQENRIVGATNLPTVADGLRTSLGSRTFPIIRDRVERIVTVSEEQIIAATRFVWERGKIVVEPSAAVPIAALIAQKCDAKAKHVGVIVSGGNVSLDKLPWQ